MEKWTLDRQRAGCHKMVISFGARPFWCQFDYVASHDEAAVGVDVVIGQNADADTVKWFDDIRQGIEEGVVDLEKHLSRSLVQVRVEITRVYTHSTDTSAYGCRRYGWSFIYDLGEHNSVRMPEADVPVVIGQ